MTDPINIEAEIEKNYKHNFAVNFLDGTAFWFGASFFCISDDPARVYIQTNQ